MQIQFRQELGKLMWHLQVPKVILELGCAEGWFTKDILKWDFDKLYLIDNWATIPNQTGDGNYPQEWHDNNYNQQLEIVKPFGDKVTIIKGLTSDVVNQIPDNSLGLIFIDACHEYGCVKSDLELYFSKVVSGGIIACHDYMNLSYGVNKAVTEFCKDKYEVHLIPDEEPAMSSCYFIKP